MREDFDRWFPQVCTKRDEDDVFVGRRALGHPMVLFSTVDPVFPVPLAALTLVSKDGGALIWQRPDAETAQFQGLVNKDGSEFKLVLTNLTQTGMINFNVMKVADPVNKVDPGGLNEVNELRPEESWSCECDQADNMALVLSSLGTGVTVKEGEKEAKGDASKAKGLYYWLSVVPDNASDMLKSLFAKTEWRTADFIVTRKKEPRRANYLLCGARGARMMNAARTPMVGTPENPFRGLESSGRSESEMNEADWAYVDSITRDEGSDHSDSEEEFLGGLHDDDELTPSMEPLERSAPTKSATPPTRGAIPRHETQTVEGIANGLGLYNHVVHPFAARSGDASSKAARSFAGGMPKSADNRQSIIDGSLAAKATHSGRKVDVYSASTGNKYAFELVSAPCVLNLSIEPRLNIIKARISDADILSHVDSAIAGKAFELLAKIPEIYTETTCVICMDDEAGPSSLVFYKCGHQCCHTACAEKLEKCPLCRTRIDGRVDLSNGGAAGGRV